MLQVNVYDNVGCPSLVCFCAVSEVGLSSFSAFPRGIEVDQLIRQYLDEHSRWQIES